MKIIAKKKDQIAKLLINAGADLDLGDISDVKPIDYAIMYNRPDIVRLIEEKQQQRSASSPAEIQPRQRQPSDSNRELNPSNSIAEAKQQQIAILQQKYSTVLKRKC